VCEQQRITRQRREQSTPIACDEVIAALVLGVKAQHQARDDQDRRGAPYERITAAKYVIGRAREPDAQKYEEYDVRLLPEPREHAGDQRIVERQVGERVKAEDIDKIATDEQRGPSTQARAGVATRGKRVAGAGDRKHASKAEGGVRRVADVRSELRCQRRRCTRGICG
jgi:hypothetical protein